MRDPRGHHVLQNLPRTGWPELEQLRERYERLQRDTAETGRKLEQLRAEHARADEQHRADYATALASDSTGEPPRKHVEKLEAEIAATRRRFEALDDATGLIEGELATLLAEHGDGWRQDAEQLREEARVAYAAALDTLARCVTQLSELAALVQFVSGPEPIAYRARPLTAPGLRGLGGDPLAVDALLGSLRVLAQSPHAREPASV